MFKCPNEDCGDNGNFTIDDCEERYAATVIVGTDGEIIEITTISGGVTWDNRSPMRCRGCGREATVKDFLVGGDA